MPNAGGQIHNPARPNDSQTPSEPLTAARRRVYGSRFLDSWQDSTGLERLMLLWGGYARRLTETPIPANALTPPLHEQASIRDQIGTVIDEGRQSAFARLMFGPRLIPIGLEHMSRRRTQRHCAPWDIGLPYDPLTIGNLSKSEMNKVIKKRKTDLTAALASAKNLKSQSKDFHFKTPLLYVSGMPYKETPSGYGVRTQTIISSLRRIGLKVKLIHMAFNLPTVDPRNITATLGPDAGLLDMLDMAVSELKVKAEATGVKSLAAGSNWMAGLCGLRAARDLGLDYIYDVRGLWPMTRAAVEPAYGNQPAYTQQMQLEWAIMRAADAVIVISTPLRDLAIQKGVDPARISVVPNMSETTSIAEPRIPKDKTIWSLGHAGSLTSYEGLDVLLTLLSKTPTLAGRPLHLWIAGTGTHADKLRRRVDNLGLNKRVTFLGRLSRQEVMKRITATDVMVYPRQNSPVFQLVPALKPVEAMRLGTPVLLSDLAPHRELAGDVLDRATLAPAPTPGDWDKPDIIIAWQSTLKDMLENAATHTHQKAVNAKTWSDKHRTADQAIKPWFELFNKTSA